MNYLSIYRILFLLFILSADQTLIKAQKKEAVEMLPDGIRHLKNNSATAAMAGIRGDGTDTMRISTYDMPSDKVSGAWSAEIMQKVNRGDILWLTFKARCIRSRRETGEAFLDIGLDRMINGKYEWPPIFERGISFGSEWTLFQIPFIAAKETNPENLLFVMRSGKMAQELEITALELKNYKQSLRFEELPRSTIHYKGGEPDAAWRKPAADRIEKYRKADFIIRVTDAKGKPLPGAEVAIALKKHAYSWGTATSSQRLLDTVNPVSAIYRDTMLRYFNKVVLENEIKWKNWVRSDHKNTFRALDWLKEKDIPVRGHVMVWPSWSNSPSFISELKDDTSAIKAAIFKNIEEQTRMLKGRFTEWDVVNEPYAHDDMLNLLGKEKMVEWFHAAHKGAPDVKLFLNDYVMFHGEGPGSASERFYDNVRFLLDRGAPIDAIGEQGHIGGSPPGIEYIIARLDRFSSLGLPVLITEFDITSDDEDFKMRYIRDFMTAVFSHPSTTGIMQWGFWEGQHWIPSAALWDKQWNIRPSGKMFTELITQTWSTNTSGSTGKQGTYQLRGFKGIYQVRVKYKGREILQEGDLSEDGMVLTIKLPATN